MKSFAIAALAAVALFAAGCAQAPKQAAPAAAPREMNVEVTDAGFVPHDTVIGKGEAVTLVITRKTEQTCATDVMFPRLGLRYDLPMDQAVRVAIPAGAVMDTMYYACGMNMITGMITAK